MFYLFILINLLSTDNFNSIGVYYKTNQSTNFNITQFIIESGLKNYILYWGYETLFQLGNLFYVDEAVIFSLGIFFLFFILFLLIVF